MDTLHLDNTHHTHDQEEEEETLSLSDLPLYSDDQGDDWEQVLSSQESTSFSSSEDDFFEFFSQEFSNPSPPAGIPPENIIFCGKLIPYKQPYCDAKSLFESRKREAHTKKDQDCGVSRWSFGSSNSTSERCMDSKNDETRAIPLTGIVQKKVKDHHHVSSPLCYSPKKVKGCDFPVQKFPVMASSSSGKAKWYLFFFGMSRLSSSMELYGINSRRSRRQYPPPVFSFRSGDKSISDDRDRGWRMGGLLGALSCGGHRHADTMVAASIGRPALK